MEKQKSLVRLAAEQTIGRALWFGARLAVRYTLDDESRANSQTAHDALHGKGAYIENPKSIYQYVNHPSELDPILTASFGQDHLTHTSHFFGVEGMRHFDPARDTSGLITLTATSLTAGYLGLTEIRMIQPDDMASYPKPTKSTDGLSARAFNIRALKQTREAMQTPGNVLFIAVEGTRHKDGILHEPPLEIHGPLKAAGETGLALPVAFVLPESGQIKPFGKPVEIRVGKPFSFFELQQEVEQKPSTTPTEIMMQRLAKLLPEQYRGVYK